MKTTEKHRQALREYRERNRGRPRLPGVYISEETNEKLEALAKIKGTKVGAISEAVDLLYEKEFAIVRII